MSASGVYVGIDVSKEYLDLDSFDHKAARIRNSPAGIQGLVRRIQTFPERIIVCCEATGGYEQLLVRMLCEQDIEICRVNPKCVRYFAISKGILAKTDSIDAGVLSAFGTSHHPRSVQPLPAWILLVRELLNRRHDLIEMRKQEQSRLNTLNSPQVREMAEAHILCIKSQIAAAEQTLRGLIRSEPQLHLNYRRLCEVKSLGFITILSLLAFVPELGTLSGNQAAALVGVAPYNNESGTKAGQRFIKGGRPKVRNPLYMAAVSATRHNPVLAEFYNRLVEKGKPRKKAITAVMRKLVVLANLLLADPDFQLS